MKIAVVTPIPTPYRDPFWNEVAKQPGVELHVYYCSPGQSDRPWQRSWTLEFEADFSPSRNLARYLPGGASFFYSPEAMRRLKGQSYDAIVLGGYNHGTMLAAIWHARRSGIPYFLMNESYLEQPRSSWKKLAKRPLVRSVVRHAAGLFPTGKLASRYLVHYGADPATLYPIPNVPDVESLFREAQRLAPQRQTIRRELGLDDRPVVLFVGRMVAFKRPHLILRAMCELLRNDEATFVVLGDGPMRPHCEQLTRELDIGRRVRFQGFIQPSELSRWHAAGDLFVLPSYGETWSVATVEALASGLPVVITRLVGCHADVINSPTVGDVVAPDDVDDLRRAIERRVRQPTPREEVMSAWQEVREGLNYGVLAERFLRGIRECIGPTSVPEVATTSAET